MKSSPSAKDAQPSKDDRGLGESTLSQRKDLRLVARALKEEWPIPARLRGKVVSTLERVLDDPEASPRDVAAASRALVQASRVNLQAVAVAIAADDHENVKERLSEVERIIEKERKTGRR